MSTSVRHYSRGRKLIAMRDGKAGISRYYSFDHQGTTQCLTDGAGNVTDRFAADAWGCEVRRTGSSINRQWYIGGAGYDTNSRTATYVRARWLNPSVAAWLSTDCIPHSPARYSYCWNAPARTVDPTGKIPPLLWAGAVLLIGAALWARWYFNRRGCCLASPSRQSLFEAKCRECQAMSCSIPELRPYWDNICSTPIMECTTIPGGDANARTDYSDPGMGNMHVLLLTQNWDSMYGLCQRLLHESFHETCGVYSTVKGFGDTQDKDHIDEWADNLFKTATDCPQSSVTAVSNALREDRDLICRAVTSETSFESVFDMGHKRYCVEQQNPFWNVDTGGWLDPNYSL